MKSIVIATAIATLTGCATAPNPSVSNSMAERAYALHETPQVNGNPWHEACYALSNYEAAIREGRANGVSAKEARTLTVMAAMQNGEAETRHGVMGGTIMFMAIDHIYAGHTDSAVSRCIAEKWPQAAYINTL